MPYDLPPWLTRQYDYAGGFRSIGNTVARNLQARRALQLQAEAQADRQAQWQSEQGMREREFGETQRYRAEEMAARRNERIDRLNRELEAKEATRQFRAAQLAAREATVSAGKAEDLKRTQPERDTLKWLENEQTLRTFEPEAESYDQATRQKVRRARDENKILGIRLGKEGRTKPSEEGSITPIQKARIEAVSKELNAMLRTPGPTKQQQQAIIATRKKLNELLGVENKSDSEPALIPGESLSDPWQDFRKSDYNTRLPKP